MQDLTLMGKVALTRLRRRERIALAAERSHSPIWRRLARQAVTAAQRDCHLAGLNRRKLDVAGRTAARAA